AAMKTYWVDLCTAQLRNGAARRLACARQRLLTARCPNHTDEDLSRPRMTTRRQILTGAVSVAMIGWASAEQRPHRLAYLVPASPAANAPNQRALFGALAELGYREGHNLVVERRFAEGRLDRLSALAAELVALKPDVLFAAGSQATLAASKATRTVPIVFVAV